MDENTKEFLGKLFEKYRSVEPLPPVVYHYTSLAAMIEIIRTGIIRCSNVRFSNDPAEVTYTHDLLRTILANKYPALALDGLFGVMEDIDYYAASFSVEGDLLPQWRAYCANGRGVAIGFNSDIFVTHTHLSFGRIDYDRLRQEAIVNDLMHVYGPRILQNAGDLTALRGIISELAQPLLIFSGLMKDHPYQSEKEYRAFVTQPRPKSYHQFPVNFRATPISVVPFLEFPLPLQNVGAVVEIIIGPCLDPTLTKPSIEAFLEQTFSAPPSVRQSTVRMRA